MAAAAGPGGVSHELSRHRFLSWSRWPAQFDQKLPAPIKAAREDGRILKHIEFGTTVSADFRRHT